MGQTDKYSLRYPDGDDDVKLGAMAMQQLAQDVEAAMESPYLITKGGGDIAWLEDKTGLVPWDLGGALAVSGDFGSGSNSLVIPPLLGVYLVTTSVRFGGKSEGDVFHVRIETLESGAPSGVIWTQEQVEVGDSSASYTQLSTSTIVPITFAGQGVRVMARYGGTDVPPQPSSSSVHRLSMYRLGT